jgi:hypothetical protein
VLFAFTGDRAESGKFGSTTKVMAVREKIKIITIRYSLFLKDLDVLTYSSVATNAVALGVQQGFCLIDIFQNNSTVEVHT